MSLQRLLSSEDGNEFSKLQENTQYFFNTPNPQRESNYLQSATPSNYLETNLAALTPESSFVAPNVFNTQSGLSAGASGKHIFAFRVESISQNYFLFLLNHFIQDIFKPPVCCLRYFSTLLSKSNNLSSYHLHLKLFRMAFSYFLV